MTAAATGDCLGGVREEQKGASASGAISGGGTAGVAGGGVQTVVGLTSSLALAGVTSRASVCLGADAR